MILILRGFGMVFLIFVVLFVDSMPGRDLTARERALQQNRGTGFHALFSSGVTKPSKVNHAANNRKALKDAQRKNREIKERSQQDEEASKL